MLTNAIRAYLRASREAKKLLADVIRELTTAFGLTPKQAGLVIAQDVWEYPGPYANRE